MPGGVRARITVLATVIVLVVLAGTGAGVVAAQRAVLTDTVDEVVQRHSAQIIRLIDDGTLTSSIPGQGDDEAFARVTDAAGRLRATTEQTIDAPLRAPAGTTASFETVHSPAGDVDYRVLSVRHGSAEVYVGTPLDDVIDSVTALTRALSVAVPAAALVLAVLVWLLVGRVLRPVEAMRSRVGEITGSNLHSRVPEPAGDDEIARLARTLNAMLERIDAASERQRLTRDAQPARAHPCRT